MLHLNRHGISLLLALAGGKRPALIAAGALLVLGACSVRQAREPDRRAELLSAAPPRDTRCVVESFPAEVPPVDAIVDAAALGRAVRELRGTEPARRGHVLLSLGFDVDGVNTRREVIEHSTTPVVADSVQRLVFAARRQTEEEEHEWGVRLRIDLDDPVQLRVGRREFCPPAARDPAVQRAMEEVAPSPVTFRGGRRIRVIHMRALVSETGVITSAHVIRGDLSGSSLERDLSLYLRQFLFIPATIDGQPTRAWIEIPLRVRA